MKPVNPRSITDAERPWLDNWTPGTIRILIRALRGQGHSNPLAFGILGMLTAKALGEPDGLSMQSRATYRKALRALADAGVTPPAARSTVVELAFTAPAKAAPGPRSTRVGTAARAIEAPSLVDRTIIIGGRHQGDADPGRRRAQAALFCASVPARAWSGNGWDVSDASRAA